MWKELQREMRRARKGRVGVGSETLGSLTRKLDGEWREGISHRWQEKEGLGRRSEQMGDLKHISHGVPCTPSGLPQQRQ